MLAKINNPKIATETHFIKTATGAQMFVKLLRGPFRSGRTAIYIHGGGSGGNHTLIERPSRHLIEDGFFDTIILPDRRGDGESSPLDHKHSVREHAEDMRALLDCLNACYPITAMGISYGGPIALDLAALDRRIVRVVLVASSPTLSANSGISRFLVQSGLLKIIMKAALSRYLGKLPPAPVDFDPAYDARGQSELVKAYTEALKRTPKDRRDSMLYALEAALDESKAGLDEAVTLSIPVLQIIGERDEVWGSRLSPETMRRFPNITLIPVPGAHIHKDVFLKPGLFYQKLAECLRDTLGPDYRVTDGL